MAEDTDYFEKFVLDEDVPTEIGYKLEGRGTEVLSHEKSASDREFIGFAIEKEAPLLTKDEDFRERNREFEHSGILIDNQMHLRDWNLVADTVKNMLENIPRESMIGNVWRVSDYYGVF
ncbi:MAG: hypothetical protein BRC29_04465 [Nanohaloarchaea archaeon SW_7_43_1]|nr:MAG: hypothetical protein BRC29_04465 [Nanohaloarchaea archaeon SW_7_43_1]